MKRPLIPAILTLLGTSTLAYAHLSDPQPSAGGLISVLQAMPCLGTITSLLCILTGLLTARVICGGGDEGKACRAR